MVTAKYVLYTVLLMTALPHLCAAEITAVRVVDPLTPVYSADSIESIVSKPKDELTLVGPRNGVCSAQAVVVGSALDQVTASVTPLVNGTHKIPPDAVSIRYAAKEENYANSITKIDGSGRTNHLAYIDPYYDILCPQPPADSGVMPVWITIEIPAETVPGDYTGTLRIGSHGVNVKLTVAAWLCPDPGAMGTHVGILPSTESLSRHYQVENWSEAHWKLIEDELRLLGKTGNDDLWVHSLYDQGWLGGPRTAGKTAMLRFKRDGERIVPDFSVIDRYFELYRRHCSKPQHIIIVTWTEGPRGRRGRPAKPEVRVVLDGERADIPRVYAPGGAEIWKPALDGIRDRVKAMGWDEDSILLGLAGDARPSKEEVAGFKSIGPYGRWAIWTHGRGEKGYGQLAPGEPWEYSNGMEIGYYAHPYTPKIYRFDRKEKRKVGVEGGILGGWRIPVNVYSSTRNDIHKYHALTQWRGYATGTCIDLDCGASGFTFLWFDWFTDAKGFTPFICRICGVMSRNNSPALIAAGPDSVLPTVRYEMLREGIQEAEARRVIEKALVGGTINGESAKAVRTVLEKQVEIRFQHGKFSGGHASNNLGLPTHMWGFSPYPEWQANTLRLFEAAATVAAERN